MKWKVGDEFVLPKSPVYKGIYKIIRVDTIKYGTKEEPVYWAYFPEDGTGKELYSEPSYMERVTKLHKILS